MHTLKTFIPWGGTRWEDMVERHTLACSNSAQPQGSCQAPKSFHLHHTVQALTRQNSTQLSSSPACTTQNQHNQALVAPTVWPQHSHACHVYLDGSLCTDTAWILPGVLEAALCQTVLPKKLPYCIGLHHIKPKTHRQDRKKAAPPARFAQPKLHKAPTLYARF